MYDHTCGAFICGVRLPAVRCFFVWCAGGVRAARKKSLNVAPRNCSVASIVYKALEDDGTRAPEEESEHEERVLLVWASIALGRRVARG